MYYDVVLILGQRVQNYLKQGNTEHCTDKRVTGKQKEKREREN